MKVGVIGAGSISEYHLRALGKQPSVEIGTIFDVNRDRARAVADRFAIPQVAKSLSDIYADGSIDAVTIGVWNAAHASVSVDALNAGKHVFCEKPMARTVNEARAMMRAEESSGKLLMIGLVRRFELRSAVARSIMESGELGKIYLVRAGYLRRDGQPGGWFATKEKAGGGALLDIGIHSLDLALHLAQLGPVERISGFTRHLGPIMEGISGTQKYQSQEAAGIHDVEDYALGTLHFASGAVMTIEASWAQHRQSDTQYLEIYGTNGGLIVDPELRLYANAHGALRDATYPLDEGEDRLQSMFDAELAHFVACVGGEERCIAPSSDGLRLMRIIESIYESSKEGREVAFSDG